MLNFKMKGVGKSLDPFRHQWLQERKWHYIVQIMKHATMNWRKTLPVASVLIIKERTTFVRSVRISKRNKFWTKSKRNC